MISLLSVTMKYSTYLLDLLNETLMKIDLTIYYEKEIKFHFIYLKIQWTQKRDCKRISIMKAHRVAFI